MDISQSTARIRVFSFIGTSITSLACTISKNGGAFGAISGAGLAQITGNYYSVTLDATDTDTLGDLMYRFTDTPLGDIAPNGETTDRVVVAPGAAGGALISGSNAGTTTLGALTVTGATTLTGAVSLGSTLGVTGTTTLAALNTGAIGTGNVTVTGTVGVSGTVTFNAFVCSNNFTVSGNWLTTGTTTWTGAAAFSGGLTSNITGTISGAVITAAGLDAIVVETGLNARQALSVIAAACAGTLTGATTPTIAIAGAGVATARISATVDASNNRTAVTLSPPA